MNADKIAVTLSVIWAAITLAGLWISSPRPSCPRASVGTDPCTPYARERRSTFG
jgi:hypothetical protein